MKRADPAPRAPYCLGRRTFMAMISGGLLAAPRAADAQQAGKVSRIGFLWTLSPSDMSLRLDAFRQGLRELGWVEGQNIVIEYRFAEGRFDRLPDLAAELVRLKVDIIVAVPTPTAVAAKNATGTIPIVMVATRPPRSSRRSRSRRGSGAYVERVLREDRG